MISLWNDKGKLVGAGALDKEEYRDGIGGNVNSDDEIGEIVAI